MTTTNAEPMDAATAARRAAQAVHHIAVIDRSYLAARAQGPHAGRIGSAR